MTSHLIAISIGPVQDFIAAARRTNDLYAGSELISSIAGAAAGALAGAGATLIFPAQETRNAPNKLLARVDGIDPKDAVSRAETAARSCLRTAWDEALQKLTPAQRAQIDPNAAEQQIGSFLEFYGAWWPWDGQDATYADARTQVDRLLAGRKALRDFVQPQKRLVPKSPLDPSRDAVVRDPKSPQMAERPLRLKEGEWLDAVSLLKRIRGAGSSAPSTADIAATTFLTGRPDLQRLIAPSPKRAIYPGYREELIEEGVIDEARAGQIEQAVGRAEPSPYFAILQADGDRIGTHLSTIGSVARHTAFSKALDDFAREAKDTVGKAQGHLVYSGGDDVLALLPVHTCLGCASALARSFAQRTGRSLSVGIAVVHFHDPLYTSLQHAREAERAAKDAGGNGVYLAVHTRGGEPRSAWHQWTNGYDLDPWRQWIDAFAQGLSAGFPYELNLLARECENTGLDAAAIQAEARRIFNRKQKSEGGSEMADIGPLLSEVQKPADLRALSARLIVFRWLKDYPMQWEVNPDA